MLLSEGFLRLKKRGKNPIKSVLAAVFCVLAGMPEKRYNKAKFANENQCISVACKGEKEVGACDFFARVKPVKKTVSKITRVGQETPVFKSEFKSEFLASMPDNVELLP